VTDPNISVHARPEFTIGPVRKPERVGIGYLAAPIIGQVADAWTTAEALRRGFREGNPLLAPIAGKPALLVALKIGAGIGFAAMTNRLAKAGHPRAARGFSVISTFLGVIPAAMNVTTMRGEGS